ncbi:hypothetical protein J6590_001480 [Homalodisca vitripennis]|nr:hypothetical protein J6590_001477 [Homalodisca vitripennis]KAG8323731.1 hypothetical protein J6590_001480 [Homalodisca vitripennis]
MTPDTVQENRAHRRKQHRKDVETTLGRTSKNLIKKKVFNPVKNVKTTSGFVMISVTGPREVGEKDISGKTSVIRVTRRPTLGGHVLLFNICPPALPAFENYVKGLAFW